MKLSKHINTNFKIKKLVLFFSCLGIHAAYAELSPYSYFDGFYAGVSGGILQTQSDFNSTATSLFQRPRPSGTLSAMVPFTVGGLADVYQDAAIGGLDIGYGHSLGHSPFYLAAEIYGNIADRNHKWSNNGYITEISTGGAGQMTFTANLRDVNEVKLNTGEFGIDLRPGIELSPYALLYGRIGAAFNHIDLKTNSTLALTNLTNPDISITTLGAHQSKNVTGLRLGGGITERVSRHVGIGANYVYTNYGHLTAQGVGNVTNLVDADFPVVADGFSRKTKVDVTSQAVLLDIDYYFNSAFDNIPLVLDPALVTNFNGFYMGVKGGGLQTRVDANINSSANYLFGGNPNIGKLSDVANLNLQKNTGLGSAFLGYGQLINQSLLYLGAEVFANYIGNHDLKINYNATDIRNNDINQGNDRFLSGNVRIEPNNFEWGGDLRPGFVVGCKTLLYGRVGVAFQDIDVASANTFTFVNRVISPSVTFVTPLSKTHNKNITALRLGGGIEESLSNHISANVDYIYTDYGSQRVNAISNISAATNSGNLVVTPDGFTIHDSIKTSSQAVLAGLTYHF